MRIRLVVLTAAALAAVAACSRKEAETGGTGGANFMRASKDTGPRALGSGDVRIEPAEGGVDIALIGDTISGGLSEATLAKTRREMDTSKVKGTGFGADIEKMVKGTVQTALGTRMGFPLSEIKGARYANGRIVFDWVDVSHKNVFDNTKVKDKPLLESFGPADAQRFVDAVNARKQIQR